MFGTKYNVTTTFSSNMQRKYDLDKILFMFDKPLICTVWINTIHELIVLSLAICSC